MVFFPHYKEVELPSSVLSSQVGETKCSHVGLSRHIQDSFEQISLSPVNTAALHSIQVVTQLYVGSWITFAA